MTSDGNYKVVNVTKIEHIKCEWTISCQNDAIGWVYPYDKAHHKYNKRCWQCKECEDKELQTKQAAISYVYQEVYRVENESMKKSDLNVSALLFRIVELEHSVTKLTQTKQAVDTSLVSAITEVMSESLKKGFQDTKVAIGEIAARYNATFTALERRIAALERQLVTKSEPHRYNCGNEYM
jgi:phenylpyruvate tautomerase PptA (4-oxalocrotonate tautomerase family)